MISRLSSVVVAVLLLTAGVGGVMAVSTDAFAQTDDTPADETTPGDTDHPEWSEKLEAALQQLDLTDEEVEDIVSEAEAMRTEGATHREIEAMVGEKLDDYGVDVSALRPVVRHYHRHHHDHSAPWDVRLERFLGLFDLTDEEIDAIVDDADAMHDDGASKQEIREYVLGELADEGYDREDVFRTVFEQRAERLQERFDLTDAQTDELVDDVVNLWLDGGDRDEIRNLVHEKLEEFGADVPDTDRRRDGPRQPRR